MVRYLAGGRYELDEAAPVDAGALMGAGPVRRRPAPGWRRWLRRRGPAERAARPARCPVLGELHLVTSLFFDVGVYLVVVGLVLDLLRSLGAEIDRQVLRRGAERRPRTAR